MAMVNKSNLPSPVQRWYDKVLLSVDSPKTIHRDSTDVKMMPLQNGKTIRREGYERLGLALTSLGDSGITPEGSLLESNWVDINVSLYGDYVRISEDHAKTTASPVLNQRARLLAQQMKETEDALIRNSMKSTLTGIDCSAGVNGDVPTEIQLSDVQTAVQALKDADAIELMAREDASKNIGTASVGASYRALGHTSLMPTLKAITNFVETKDYSRTGSVKPSEFGAVYYTRFFLSTLGSINANASGLGSDVYDIFVKGVESDIAVKMMGKSKFIYHDKNLDGPLELSTTGGWTENFGHGIQKQKWIVRLRSTLKI